MSIEQERWRLLMKRALELAARGRYSTAPNPRVGCVIAQLDDCSNPQNVGEGFHQRAGEPHAEVLALRQAGDAARGATAIVTLEPCAHHGRTPPCADALIKAGIRTVVVATKDPFPEVSGKGLARLAEAGVHTEVGLMEAESRWLNRGFLSRQLRGRPWIILKVAVSLDGRICTRTGDSQWISGPVSRGVVHRLRAEADAVVVGAGTFRADNPQLTPRNACLEIEATPTVRIVIAGTAPLPKQPKLIDTNEPALVIAPEGVPAVIWPGIETVYVQTEMESDQNKGVNLESALQVLAKRDIGLALVEGGAGLATSLLEKGLVDELVVFSAPVLIGGADAPSFWEGSGIARMADALRPQVIDRRIYGDDTMIHAVLKSPSELGVTGFDRWPEGLIGLPDPPEMP